MKPMQPRPIVTVADLLKKHSVVMTATRTGMLVSEQRSGRFDRDPGTSHWRCEFRMGSERMTVRFHQGSAISEAPKAPDVMSCLLMDATEETFASWASEYGYDVDSRSAERVWKACAQTAEKLDEFLGAARAEFDRAERE